MGHDLGFSDLSQGWPTPQPCTIRTNSYDAVSSGKGGGLSTSAWPKPRYCESALLVNTCKAPAARDSEPRVRSYFSATTHHSEAPFLCTQASLPKLQATASQTWSTRRAPIYEQSSPLMNLCKAPTSGIEPWHLPVITHPLLLKTHANLSRHLH